MGSIDLDPRLRKLRVAFAGLTRRRFRPVDFDELVYDRLNAAYESIHGLCRVILQGRGAEDGAGTLPMGSLLVNMDTLFEQFVAEWLRQHLPPPWRVEAQETVRLDESGGFSIRPDLVLYHGSERRLVADTKHQLAEGRPSVGHLYQILAYCRALRLRTGVLLYPDLDQPGDRLVVADGANALHADGVDLRKSWAEIEEGMRRLTERLLTLAETGAGAP